MHICFVESGYPQPQGGGGGAGTYVQLIGRELVELGHHVRVIARWYSNCAEKYDDQGVIVYRPRNRRILHKFSRKSLVLKKFAGIVGYLEEGLNTFRLLNKLHRELSIDLVEYTEGGDFWQAVRPTFPYISHLHGSSYTFRNMTGRSVNAGYRYGRKMHFLFIKKAKYIFSPSQALLDIVAKEAGQPFEKALVLPYPLDVRLLEQVNRSKRDSSRLIVLFAARNDWVKGADVLLKAVPMITAVLPNVEFRFFGFRPNGRELPDKVNCFPFIPKEQLIEQYRGADLCVVPSRWDNSPNTVYEAMAAGKPVVASRVGGIPELVVDGDTGLLVPQDDPDALAQAIIQLLRDPERECFGLRGKERIRKLADLGDNLRKRLVIYNQVAGSNKREIVTH